MRVVTAWYNQSLRANARTGWRQRLGMVLRDLAERIDGRRTLALDIRSTPPLSPQQLDACIDQGLDAMLGAIHSEVRSECIENVMRRELPRLYEEEQASTAQRLARRRRAGTQLPPNGL